MATATQQQNVTAQYASPSGRHTFTLPISSPTSTPNTNNENNSTTTTTEQRTAYLHALRAGTRQLQADVNEFLTKKMEEDNNKEKASASGGAKKREEELDEEENYGEEVAEEDAD